MDAEAAYLEALAALDRVLTEGSSPGARGGRRAAGLPLGRRGELIPGEWQIVNVATADALASVVSGTEPVIRVERDGTAVVEGGCNAVRSTWTLDGSQRTFANRLRRRSSATDRKV